MSRDAAEGRLRPRHQGLRAIAVEVVLLFHFSVWPFGGGFTGVDVLFVISGFPMTDIIVRRQASGDDQRRPLTLCRTVSGDLPAMPHPANQSKERIQSRQALANPSKPA